MNEPSRQGILRARSGVLSATVRFVEGKERRQDNDQQFDLIVLGLRPWADRVERRETRHSLWLQVLSSVIVGVAAITLACAVWWFWTSIPPLSVGP